MKELKSWSIIGAVFSAGAGVLLHFVYDIFGGPVWSFLGAVNESTWEHLKLLFWPVSVFMVLEYLAYGRELKRFIPVRFLGLLAGMASIVILFYTYSGILGYNISVVNILLFFVGVAVTYLIPLVISRFSDEMNDRSYGITCADIAAAAGLAVFAILFIVFTFEPPQLGIFEDPLIGSCDIFY